MQTLRLSLLVGIIVTLQIAVFVRARTSVIGCFKDKKNNRALQKLANYRKFLDWRDFKTVITVIQKCEDEARKEGYRCFAIQFYGECWSGETACEDYMEHGPSKECFCSGDGYKPYVSREEPCRGGVGGALANFVYRIWP